MVRDRASIVVPKQVRFRKTNRNRSEKDRLRKGPCIIEVRSRGSQASARVCPLNVMIDLR